MAKTSPFLVCILTMRAESMNHSLPLPGPSDAPPQRPLLLLPSLPPALAAYGKQLSFWAARASPSEHITYPILAFL